MDPYKYVNNLGRDITSYDIDQEFPLKIKLGKTIDEKKSTFNNLPEILKYICITGSISLNKLDYLMTNPTIIYERHHHVFDKHYNYSKDKYKFTVHSDRDGPPGGKKCYTILFYYNIDNKIINSYIHFYDYKENPDKHFCLSCTRDEMLYKKTGSIPLKTGDIISFEDNVLHCPSAYNTNSKTSVERGLIVFFILL